MFIEIISYRIIVKVYICSKVLRVSKQKLPGASTCPNPVLA